jgi:hypothetical protein
MSARRVFVTLLADRLALSIALSVFVETVGCPLLSNARTLFARVMEDGSSLNAASVRFARKTRSRASAAYCCAS